jgi:hypothetical protein
MLRIILVCYFLIMGVFANKPLKKLHLLLIEEKYAKLTKKAQRYALSKKYEKEAFPYLFWSMGLFYSQQNTWEEREPLQAQKHTKEREKKNTQMLKALTLYKRYDKKALTAIYLPFQKDIQKFLLGELNYHAWQFTTVPESERKLQSLVAQVLQCQERTAGLLFLQIAVLENNPQNAMPKELFEQTLTLLQEELAKTQNNWQYQTLKLGAIIYLAHTDKTLQKNINLFVQLNPVLEKEPEWSFIQSLYAPHN